MGKIGVQELLLILGISLLIFGPKKLPELGKSLGRTISEFRNAANTASKDIDSENPS